MGSDITANIGFDFPRLPCARLLARTFDYNEPYHVHVGVCLTVQVIHISQTLIGENACKEYIVISWRAL